MPQAELLVVYELAQRLAIEKGPGFHDTFLGAQAAYEMDWKVVLDEIKRRPRDLGFLRTVHPDMRIQRETEWS